MPLYESNYIEYPIQRDEALLNIGAVRVRSYFAHADLGRKVPGVVLLHDWWGMTTSLRVLADFLAQLGYTVLAPDMYDGAQVPFGDAREALRLLEKTRATRYQVVDAAITAIETHHMTTSKSVVVGVGMGGTLAFEAAIRRSDLEAAVIFGGFPQAYLGQFAAAKTPLYAVYGADEPWVKPEVIAALHSELSQSPLAAQHHIERVAGFGHEFFPMPFTQADGQRIKPVMEGVLAFMHRYAPRPQQPPKPVW